MKFRLSNSHGFPFSLALEPEGDVIEISADKHVYIELIGSNDPVVDLKINQLGSSLTISVWPFKGDYKVHQSDKE